MLTIAVYLCLLYKGGGGGGDKMCLVKFEQNAVLTALHAAQIDEDKDVLNDCQLPRRRSEIPGTF